MLKRKKILIPIVVLVLMLAMTVTAYAITETCTLLASDTGSQVTPQVLARWVHRAAYNQWYSTNSMIVRLQWKPSGTWEKVLGDYQLAPGADALHEPENDFVDNFYFRTKIYSRNFTGGAEGVGSINGIAE